MCWSTSKAVRLQSSGLGSTSRSAQTQLVFKTSEDTEACNTGLRAHQQNQILFGFGVVSLAFWVSMKAREEDRLDQIRNKNTQMHGTTGFPGSLNFSVKQPACWIPNGGC